MSLEQYLQQRLVERRAQSRYRARSQLQTAQSPTVERDNEKVLNFCSNDYLGLANHPKVVAAFRKAAKEFGVGSGASHLVCGHSRLHHELEEALAEFTGRERALLFSSGYMANLGTINALIGRSDAIFQDKLNHASIIDAGQLCKADFVRFRHNDTAHLRQRLHVSDATHKLIVVDGVFSMDGDLAPLDELAKVACEHSAWLMVDDAHGFGVLGEKGAGITEHFHLSHQQVPVLMATLGKALGTYGAFVAGSNALIESLIQFARPYIYTTAIPPALAAATLASLHILQQEPERRAHLNALIKHFRDLAAHFELPLMASNTAIQPLLVGSDQKALQLAEFLKERHFWVSAIRPPTVPEGTARLRITLSAAHTELQVTALVTALAEGFKTFQGLR